ncbi:MAG: YggT family protein [Negativicutes bacterium]|nr:YggT family protein [Negativicutes bacterium]
MIGRLLSTLIEVVKWVILVRLFADLFVRPPKKDWLLTLERWTEPLLAPFRRFLKPIEFGSGYIDLSPVILFFVLSLLQSLVSWLF